MNRETEPLVAESVAFRAILEQARAIAASPHPVLLLGETGVGKERVARVIHGQGPRRDRPFVAVNCGGISEALLLTEMFGHVRGAFTGADSDHLGHLRAAAGGTLLLDEVGDLPPAAQVALLRALDGQEVHPVGGTLAYHLDARVIAATECDLKSLVDARAFRPALFHRLASHVLHVPPLRERREDIFPLAEAVLDSMRRRGEADGEFLGPQARSALLAHPWPGNVRELRNVVTSAVYEHGKQDLSGIACLLAGGVANATRAVSPAQRTALRREPTDIETEVLVALRQRGRCSIAVLARSIGRNAEIVRLALPPLVAAGIVLKGGRGRGSWISANPESETMAILGD